MLVEKNILEAEYPLKEILKLIASKASQGYRTKLFLEGDKMSLVCKRNVADTILSLNDRARITDLSCAIQYKLPPSQLTEREAYLYTRQHYYHQADIDLIECLTYPKAR